MPRKIEGTFDIKSTQTEKLDAESGEINPTTTPTSPYAQVERHNQIEELNFRINRLIEDSWAVYEAILIEQLKISKFFYVEAFKKGLKHGMEGTY